MSCLSQHKTKEELSDWLMDNASDNETTGFLDMLAGDIWGMMNAEVEELQEELDNEEPVEGLDLVSCLWHQIKNLKENLQQEKDGRCSDLDELEKEIHELQEENKKLKEEVEIQRKANEAYEDLMSGMIDKIKKLKE